MTRWCGVCQEDTDHPTVAHCSCPLISCEVHRPPEWAHPTLHVLWQNADRQRWAHAVGRSRTLDRPIPAGDQEASPSRKPRADSESAPAGPSSSEVSHEDGAQ